MTWARTIASFTAGLLVAVVLHYWVYRIGIPVVPFIYQAF